MGRPLGLLNAVLSRPFSAGVAAYLGLFSLTWTLAHRVNSSLGVAGGMRRFIAEIGISAALPLGVFLLRPLRWHFLHRSLRDEIPWFRKHKAGLLVGVGPGGAIMAGMIAKLLAEVDGKEPEIAVIDRVYSADEYGEIHVTVDTLSKQLNVLRHDIGVVIVTPEIHGGETIRKVCQHLMATGIEARVFAYLWSPVATRKPHRGVDRYVLRTDHRGLLPWPDAPAKEEVADVV